MSQENEKISMEDQGDVEQLLKEFNENPFDPEKKTPADVMRIFFMKNVSIIPVVSRRKVLIGVITRDVITSEMSDIDRFSNVKIDRFVTKVAHKMTFDELLPYVENEKQFTVINIFGEIQGTWSRLELLAACENIHLGGADPDREAEKQKEEQVMEWMIYLILEHIPRPLYAVNDKGRTIFYNSYFEEIIEKKTAIEDYDIADLEKSLLTPEKNDYFFKDKKSSEMYFYNKDYDFYYEKVPMNSNGREVGFLIYCTGDPMLSVNSSTEIIGSGKLSKRKDEFERLVLVETLQKSGLDISKTAKELGISAKVLDTKIKKFNINLKK